MTLEKPIDILADTRRIIVVGCSATPGKDAHEVPHLMLTLGYDVVPVNPRVDEVFGRKAYASIADVPGTIDMVNVFRPAEEAPEIARQAVAAGARSLWLQLGIVSPEARAIAEAAGIRYVEDRCLKIEQSKLGTRRSY